MIISITNPTAYDAIVTILAETAAQAREALPLNSFIDWQKVNIKAGKTKEFNVEVKE